MPEVQFKKYFVQLKFAMNAPKLDHSFNAFLL